MPYVCEIGTRGAFRELRCESNSSDYRARYYHRTLQRFISEDAMESHYESAYSYVKNSPIALTDPYGLFPVPGCVRKLLSPYFPNLDFDTVDLHNMVPLPGGVNGFTWGNDVFIAPSQYDVHSALGISLIGHEITHVQDFQRLGESTFAGLYGLNFAINYYFNGNDSDKAYRDVSFEMDAYAMGDRIHNDLFGKFGLGGDPCPPQTTKGKCGAR